MRAVATCSGSVATVTVDHLARWQELRDHVAASPPETITLSRLPDGRQLAMTRGPDKHSYEDLAQTVENLERAQKRRAQTRRAGERRGQDRHSEATALDRQILKHATAYRAKHPYNREHSTRALAQHIAHKLVRPVGTIRDRLKKNKQK